MNSNTELILAASTETGNTGIPHLKRVWGKTITGANITGQYNDELERDAALFDILGLGLLLTYQFLHAEKPAFETFEQWVVAQNGGVISSETIQRCKNLFGNMPTVQPNGGEDVLTPDDISFWNEHGYVVIRNAISAEDCAASRKAIWHYLEMDERNPATWYGDGGQIQGIMVPLYRHAAIDKNRNSAKIRRAFEQLWNQPDLIVTTDKCGFNPPETNTVKYQGIGLHWDVSLAMPIPFGTQGILYLTDTAANQGALTIVPGFHKIIDGWLTSLPAHVNPRETNFTAFSPKPIAANAGDFIIWNHLLPHSSSPNTSTGPRLVQYINWYAPLQKKQEVWL
jgi:hypothetical protein